MLDYPFVVAYSGFNACLCAEASDALGRGGARRLAGLGRAVALAQIAAGACDAAENTALLKTLADPSGLWPALARACATAKFALLAIGWAYAGLGLASRGARALRGARA